MSEDLPRHGYNNKYVVMDKKHKADYQFRLGNKQFSPV